MYLGRLAELIHGLANANVDFIIPEFLTAVPNGVFKNESLQMRIDPEGIKEKNQSTGSVVIRNKGVIRIYTVGENGIDDGGYNSSSREETGSLKNPDDIVFGIHNG